MQIKFKEIGSIHAQTVIEVQEQDIELENVYAGIGIKTEKGLFGICQRDGGIEVMLDGKLVWTLHELINKE